MVIVNSNSVSVEYILNCCNKFFDRSHKGESEVLVYQDRPDRYSNEVSVRHVRFLDELPGCS